MALDHQPDDLLSRRHSRDVPQGRWTDSAVATDAGARGARPYFAWPERTQVPQIARLTAVAPLRCVWIGRVRLSWSADTAIIRELFCRKRECIPREFYDD